ncbi:spore coat protein GerQ [Shouchella tritolerans]|uniref:spore coat protein GerQ n=1 Tax=Shouchella tritolerans TaxID=2979466 RepID=UPI000A5BEE91|nr:spore coat protein GerQ [Shouchella tritolerans]
MYSYDGNEASRQQQGYGPYGGQGQGQQQMGQQPQFSAQGYQVPGFVQQQQTPPPGQGGMLPLEQSFIENILRLNRGKFVTVHQTFEGNSEWNARVFRGRIEEAGRDHIVLGNPETGEHYLLLMVNLDFVTFDEPIDYTYQYGYEPGLSQYPPR